ncbi:MAG TPA: hypothetical protein VGD60_12440 [Candidatus Acidoferrales bacterium]
MNVHIKQIPMYLAIGALALSSATATVYAVSAITTPGSGDDTIHAAEELFREKIEPANNVAYRDGLYQGKLAGARGSVSVPAIGRWNAPVDRASFREGYRQAIGESPVANR